MANEADIARTAATAVLGIDTLWGGDVMNPSGAGRFIADSWFADEALPPAYTHPAAARLRESGGAAAKEIDAAAIDAYLDAVDVPAAIRDLAVQGRDLGGLRGATLAGLADSFQIMWELALEKLGRGQPVPYERCVIASAGAPPEPSRPEEKLRQVGELLARAGYPSSSPEELLRAADAWRQERLVPKKSIPQLAGAYIALLEEGTRRHVVPYLPAALRDVPRANIQFLPIANAWFSGSMNYVGRARNPDGSPQYEASYEINDSLQISVPEFAQLVSHEVVPGHVTTIALLQALYVRRRVGFEATVQAMNTRSGALCEGIANNALLMAFGVKEIDELPDADMKIGMLLSLLQDDAKNQAAWLIWREGRPQPEVAAVLRGEYLCSEERAEKLSGPWGHHPLMGRMCMACYRTGTEKVAELRRRHPPERLIPALYGAYGLVDLVTIDQALAEGAPARPMPSVRGGAKRKAKGKAKVKAKPAAKGRAAKVAARAVAARRKVKRGKR